MLYYLNRVLPLAILELSMEEWLFQVQCYEGGVQAQSEAAYGWFYAPTGNLSSDAIISFCIASNKHEDPEMYNIKYRYFVLFQVQKLCCNIFIDHTLKFTNNYSCFLKNIFSVFNFKCSVLLPNFSHGK